jgi:hypothetical protein
VYALIVAWVAFVGWKTGRFPMEGFLLLGVPLFVWWQRANTYVDVGPHGVAIRSAWSLDSGAVAFGWSEITEARVRPPGFRVRNAIRVAGSPGSAIIEYKLYDDLQGLIAAVERYAGPNHVLLSALREVR